MTDEKFLDKKMDRREFLKKAGIGGAGLALGLSGASAFFANQALTNRQLFLLFGRVIIEFLHKYTLSLSFVSTAIKKV